VQKDEPKHFDRMRTIANSTELSDISVILIDKIDYHWYLTRNLTRK